MLWQQMFGSFIKTQQVCGDGAEEHLMETLSVLLLKAITIAQIVLQMQGERATLAGRGQLQYLVFHYQIPYISKGFLFNQRFTYPGGENS